MRYFFVHQNFPAQFLHLVRHLARSREHDIVFVTEANRNQIGGVRKVVYKMPRGCSAETHRDAREFEQAMLRAEAVAQVAANLKQLGYQPDIIIGHQGWGEMLNLPDVWPDTPMLGYQEFFYHTHDLDVGFDPEFPPEPLSRSRIRAKNAVNLLSLNVGAHGQTPTRFQHSTYPDWARPSITVLPEGVDLATCAPPPARRRSAFQLGDFTVAPGEKLVTYVARDLEPYRGFHIMMRALPKLQRMRPDVKVILVGGDGVSYGARLANGTWRQLLLTELDGKLDLTRIHFPGRLAYSDYLALLRRSDAHVYLTYPFVASWSLREALACGCAVVASDTAPVQEFVSDRQTGLLTPCLDPNKLADSILTLLEDAALAKRLRRNARAWAEENLRLDDYLKAYEALITGLL